MNFENVRTLVFDKDDTSATMLSDSLSSLKITHHLVSEKSQLPQAFIQANREGRPFDVVMLDCKSDCREVAEILQSIDYLPLKNPVFMLIAREHHGKECRDVCGTCGATVKLQKPLTLSSLSDAFANALEFAKKGEMKKYDEPSAVYAHSDVKSLMDELKGTKILVTDDNVINRKVITSILEQAGVSVYAAENGLEALQKAQNMTFDAILMDIQMPVMDGITATQKIRQLAGKKAKVPIIAVSAHAMAIDKEKGLKAGLNDYITKPVRPDYLYASLVRHIKEAKKGENKKIKNLYKIYDKINNYDKTEG